MTRVYIHRELAWQGRLTRVSRRWSQPGVMSGGRSVSSWSLDPLRSRDFLDELGGALGRIHAVHADVAVVLRRVSHEKSTRVQDRLCVDPPRSTSGHEHGGHQYRCGKDQGSDGLLPWVVGEALRGEPAWTGTRDSNEMPGGWAMPTGLTRVSGASAFHHETLVSQDGTS